MPDDPSPEPRPDARGTQGSAKPLPGGDPKKADFTPEVLDRTLIAIPLLRDMAEADETTPFEVIIDLNLEYHHGRQGARERVMELVRKAKGSRRRGLGVDEAKSRLSHQYVFATLEVRTIRELARLDGEAGTHAHRAIYRIWPDFEVRAFTNRSVSTVKADAARAAFAASGEQIVWAVLDSGIDEHHPHFELHRNLVTTPPLMHRDFTAGPGGEERPLVDEFGHGTHVAGIIAGELTAEGFAAWALKQDGEAVAAPDAAAAAAPAAGGEGAPDAAAKLQIPVVTRRRSEQGEVAYETSFLPAISGMAPRCKLVSLKVLDANGRGRTSSLIAAIEQVQEINGFGRRLRIHGVNLSVGYDFEPEWFACGQSPLCVEVDRLVRSGVVVVVAAGNTGYGVQQTKSRGPVATGMDLSINDPGNAELAITVGSTHRDMPHVYGVSYFSSKGPTGDGRLKPDLVAPGEKIVSCAAGSKRTKVPGETSRDFQYVEDSGTSMAAPHVSGVIAAFLSVRQEFIGNPEAVKKIFLSTATDLKRDRYFQGNGLVDLMRAIQSV
ncbi:MAG: S8 family peptidase [Gemmatimonadota bacterium]